MNITHKIKYSLVAATMAATLALPVLASAEEIAERPSAAAMTVDLVVARPLLLVSTVLGAAVFIVSSPFSALGGNFDEAADTLVVSPAKATFARCLGCTIKHQ